MGPATGTDREGWPDFKATTGLNSLWSFPPSFAFCCSFIPYLLCISSVWLFFFLTLFFILF